MEQKMMPYSNALTYFPSAKRGFMLVTVLVITGVGLLFGAGALLLFRYQCQLRIDRQHELEKVYAVRSALNYIMACDGNIKEGGKYFKYHTWSERELGLFVKPVEAIFPDLKNELHFAMQQGDFVFPCAENYNGSHDYEYGGSTNLNENSIYNSYNSLKGLAFGDLSVTNNVKWWVNIGMRDTGGWLQEDYGRRYYFQPLNFVKGEATGDTNDIMRLCIIRNVTNRQNDAGCKHGWPLSHENERALVFEISPRNSGQNNTNNAEMAFYEYMHDGVDIKRRRLIHLSNCPSLVYMGLQLANDKASIFYIGNATVNAIPDGGGYDFSESATLTQETYEYFSKSVTIGGISYPGIVTNLSGKVQAPELRAVFEVETVSPNRSQEAQKVNFLTNFKVTPAYQYDVFLEYPALVTNRATVAQKIGTYNRNQGQYFTVLTYDTHGTDHKGFRQDEREATGGSGR